MKPAYAKPEVRSVPSGQLIESLGVAIAGTYHAGQNFGMGD
ncbi:MAG TPA: hypothetical protein VJS92_08910 [Candidatus Polarisedimenticolaceae bacterium]|nr:hypothetical protein [Candidatus Polarisedimenticolaceae bacterium]